MINRSASLSPSSEDPQPPKLLDQLQTQFRLKHYSNRTEEAYIMWARRFILFHQKRHPRDMGVPEIEQFLSDLAVTHHVAGSTQNQALCALMFLYWKVLHIELGNVQAIRAHTPRKLPTVFSRQEIAQIFAHLDGIYWLMGYVLNRGRKGVVSPADMVSESTPPYSSLISPADMPQNDRHDDNPSSSTT
jgi:hypothetical protein